MDEHKVKYTLSYPDSIKILEEANKKDDAMRRLMEDMLEDNQERLIRAVNKCLYETAEQQGISLYHLCFHTIPTTEYKGMTCSVRLAPVEFDLTHDGGYWKQKYFELKNKIQDIING